MKKVYLILAIVLAGVCESVCGQQTVMSDDEMEAFAEQINECVLAERYEEAIVLYEANRAYVNPKALCRQDRGWWKETAAELEEKLREYNSNRAAVVEAQRLYDAKEYRRCIDQVDGLKLDTTNVYREYLAVFGALRDSILGFREKIAMLSEKMPGYIAEYRAGRYEGLYGLLETEHIVGYVAPELRGDVEEMVKGLDTRLRQNVVEIVMSGTRLSLGQIRRLCNGDVSRLLYLLQLDVIHYYNLLFDTEQQIVRYKEGAEYAAKMAELITIREEGLRTLYCQEEVVDMGRYDAAEGCFHALIGTNKGANLPYFNYKTADPPKGFGKRFEKVVHEALTIKTVYGGAKVSQYRNSERFEQHYMVVKVDREVAAKVDGRRCRMIVCFVPAGLKEYVFTGAELQTANGAYDVFAVRQEFPYSVECRVLLYAEDGTLVYDSVEK